MNGFVEVKLDEHWYVQLTTDRLIVGGNTYPWQRLFGIDGCPGRPVWETTRQTGRVVLSLMPQLEPASTNWIVSYRWMVISADFGVKEARSCLIR
jgi:hypothetical protein